VQGTRPNADSAFAEYILCAHTRTEYDNFHPLDAISIPRIRAVLRVTGEPTNTLIIYYKKIKNNLILLYNNKKEAIKQEFKENKESNKSFSLTLDT